MSNDLTASIVVLNWNGKDLLDLGLRSIYAAIGSESLHEVIVVDNGSSDDSVAFVRREFPKVRIVELPNNVGFSQGNNTGVRAAQRDIVVLLNNDMIVDADFLEPLIEQFHRDDLFAATCQVYLQDPNRRREETGLTRGELALGDLRLHHAPAESLPESAILPVLWAGGGSTAYHREKFLELGGFDGLYSPAYVEDVALSYAAWRRGWSSVFVARSRVHHKHRATSGRVLGHLHVDRLIWRNQILFVWRQLGWRCLLPSLFFLPWQLVRLAERQNTRGALEVFVGCLLRLPDTISGRISDIGTNMLTDSEIFAIGWGPESCEFLFPSTAAIRIQQGWHGLEFGAAGHPYRWITGRAVAYVAVSEQHFRLCVSGWAPPFLFQDETPIEIVMRLGDASNILVQSGSGAFTCILDIAGSESGWCVFTLEVSRTFCPAHVQADADTRELGLQILGVEISERVDR